MVAWFGPQGAPLTALKTTGIITVQGQVDIHSQRALLVTISGARNADVDPARGSTIVSKELRSQLVLTFEGAINEVCILNASEGIDPHMPLVSADWN